MQSHDELHHRGFAGAIGPDQSEDFARPHLEGDVLRRHQPAKTFGQALHCQQRLQFSECVYDSSRRRSSPISPSTENRMTSRATADTTKVLSCPRGRNTSPARIKNMAPIPAPTMVRRPPSTAAMITCTPTATSTTVPTEAVPR